MAAASSQLEPGVLPHQAILELCGLKGNSLSESKEQGPIQPCRRENVRSASYDLRLGQEYHFSDGSPPESHSIRNMKVLRLTEKSDEHIILPPNQVVVLSCLEKICLPKDMVGHLSLKQDILLQGLIMSSQSQIDAGYRGWIYPLLYNLTDGEVTLRLDQSVIRLELVRLPQATDRPYEGDYQERGLSRSLKRPIRSSLADLRAQVEEERKRIGRFKWVASAIALAALAVPFLTGFIGEVRDARVGVAKLEGQIEKPLKLRDRKIRQLESQVAVLQCEVLEPEAQPKPNRC